MHVRLTHPPPFRGPNPSKVMQQLLALRVDQQLHIFNALKAHLMERGLLPAAEEVAAQSCCRLALKTASGGQLPGARGSPGDSQRKHLRGKRKKTKKQVCVIPFHLGLSGTCVNHVSDTCFHELLSHVCVLVCIFTLWKKNISCICLYAGRPHVPTVCCVFYFPCFNALLNPASRIVTPGSHSHPCTKFRF